MSTETNPDKYDEAVAYLLANPSLIRLSWGSPTIRKGGCLFNFMLNPQHDALDYDHRAHCLTTFRNAPKDAESEYNVLPLSFLNRLKGDSRIPTDIDSFHNAVQDGHISTDDLLTTLVACAEYQRELDSLIGFDRKGNSFNPSP